MRPLLASTVPQFAIAFLWGGLLALFLPLRVADLAPPEWKGTYHGALLAAGGLLASLTQVFVGAWSDAYAAKRGHRRPFLLWGTLLSIPFLLGLAFADNFWLLLLLFLGLQLFANLAISPFQALIADWLPRSQHGRASGLFGLFGVTGQFLGLLWMGLLMGEEPLLLKESPLRLRALVALLGTALVWSICMGIQLWLSRDLRKQTPGGANFWSLRFWEARDFTWLLVSRLFFNTSFYVGLSFLVFYLRDTMGYADPARLALLLMLLATVAGALGNPLAGALADRLSKRRLIWYSTALTGLGVLLFVGARSAESLWFAVLLFGFSWGAFSAVDWAFACNLLPRGEEAKYMGFWSLAWTAAQVLAPLFGPIGDAGNRWLGEGAGWRIVFLLALLPLLLGAVLLLPVREPTIVEDG